jgi:MFS family permease
MGLHLCVIRHWLAGNLIITQGGQFITTFDSNLGHYTSLIINLVQFVFVILGLVWFQKYVGKRPMFLFSISLLAIINIGLGLAMMAFYPMASLTIMIIYMIVYGGSFISPIWSYPSEVIPAS